MTKQHVLPDRIKNIIPRSATTHTQTITNFRPMQKDVPFSQEIRVLQGDLGTKKIRRVCGSCNSGWIKDIEEKAFEVITPLVLGRPAALTKEDQSKIAAVASTIFAMVDLTDPSTSAISDAERRYIFDHHKAPSNWNIFIGRCDSSKLPLFGYCHHGLTVADPRTLEDAGATPRNVQLSTVRIGCLLLHVVSFPVGLISLDSRYYGNNLQIELVTPPIRDFAWERMHILGPDKVSILVGSFTLHVMRLAPMIR